jgi:hypothetical protein
MVRPTQPVPDGGQAHIRLRASVATDLALKEFGPVDSF